MRPRAWLAALVLLALLLSACGQKDPLTAAEDAARRGKRPDFTELQSLNPDIAAWLSIPGSGIGGPVLRSPTDDLYYTSHAADGSPDSGGALFVQASYSSPDLNDPVTLVYGASDVPGKLFAGLQSLYSGNSALKEHQQILLYTPEGSREWQVFGVSVWDDLHIPSTYRKFTDPRNIPLFVGNVKGYHTMVHQFDESVDISAADRLLLLSAHVKDSPEERFLVLAKPAETPIK